MAERPTGQESLWQSQETEPYVYGTLFSVVSLNTQVNGELA
jgi:hypothetical protein